MSSWANTYFGDQLVTKSGLQSTSEVLKGKKYVGIYFRSFTPVLSEFYEQLKEEDENSLEVIFASSDSDANSFNSYYGEMPWNAIPFEHPSIKEALSTRFAVRGIPTFIILNMADGSVKDSDGRSTVAAAKGNISKVLGKWA